MVHVILTRLRAFRKSDGNGAFNSKDCPVLGCETFILTACRSCLAAHGNCIQQNIVIWSSWRKKGTHCHAGTPVSICFS